MHHEAPRVVHVSWLLGEAQRLEVGHARAASTFAPWAKPSGEIRITVASITNTITVINCGEKQMVKT